MSGNVSATLRVLVRANAARRAAFVVALCLTSLAVQAQEAPQAPLVTPRDLRPETPAQPPASQPQPAPDDAPPKSEELFVIVENVVVEDGFAEFAAATEALIGPVRAQRISVAELYRLGESIEKLYREAGYSLVRVVVPPQTLNDGGTLRLIVLDGFIERIDTDAVPEHSRGRVRAVMQDMIGQRHLRSDVLVRALTIAGRGPGLALRSALGAGAETGGVVLVLQGELVRATASLSIDNRLSDSLGPWQSTAQVTSNELFVEGGQLYIYGSGGENWFTAFDRDAPRRVAGGGIIIPLGVDGLALNPEYTWSDTQPAATPFVPRSQSQFERFTTRLIYPLILERNQELTLTGSFDASSQEDSLPDFLFTLDKDRLRVARIGAGWNTTLASVVRLRTNATLSQGISGLGARTQADAASSGIPLSRPGADPGFSKIEVNLVIEQPLPAGVQSRLLARAQEAFNDVLPSSELFTLSGEDALSLFTSGTLSEDSGWTLRQEFARPIPEPLGMVALTLMPYLFAAGGKAYSELAGAADPGYNRVYGLGLRSYWKNFNLSMEYGERSSYLAYLDGTQFFMSARAQF